MARKKPSVLYAGKHLQFCRRGRWEYAHRPRISGIVGIVAVTDDAQLVLIRQYRPPLDAFVIEIPAGLAGDVAGSEDEPLSAAAKRELLEETGVSARRMTLLTSGASSAGMADEVIHLYRASGLRKVADAHGDPSESITTHLVPLERVESWIRRRQRAGDVVDLKVFAAVHFANQRRIRRRQG